MTFYPGSRWMAQSIRTQAHATQQNQGEIAK